MIFVETSTIIALAPVYVMITTVLGFAIRSSSQLHKRIDAMEGRINDRFAAQDAKIDGMFAAQNDKIDNMFAAHDVKIDGMFAAQDAKIVSIEGRLNDRFDRQDDRLEKLENIVHTSIADLNQTLGEVKGRLDELSVTFKLTIPTQTKNT